MRWRKTANVVTNNVATANEAIVLLLKKVITLVNMEQGVQSGRVLDA